MVDSLIQRRSGKRKTVTKLTPEQELKIKTMPPRNFKERFSVRG